MSSLVEALLACRARGKCKLIAIDGFGCAGKSTLAEELASLLGAACTGSDDFFLAMPESDDQSCGLDRQYRLYEMAEFLRSVQASGVGEYAPFDWKAMAIGPIRRVKQEGIYIVEGLGVLSPLFDDLYDFRIWVEGSLTDRLERVRQRDGTDYLAHWQNVLKRREDHYLATCHPWMKVDLIVCGAGASWSLIGSQLRLAYLATGHPHAPAHTVFGEN